MARIKGSVLLLLTAIFAGLVGWRQDAAASGIATPAYPVFPINAQTSTYSATADDFAQCRTISVASGTFTVTLLNPAPPNGQCVDIINYGVGVLTLNRNGLTINGTFANLTGIAGSSSAPTGWHVVSNGVTNYVVSLWSAGGGTTLAGMVNAAADIGGAVNNLTQNKVFCQDLIVPVKSTITSANTLANIGAGNWSFGIFQAGALITGGQGSIVAAPAPGPNNLPVVSTFTALTLAVGAYSICVTSDGAADTIWRSLPAGSGFYGDIANAGLSSPNFHYYQCANNSTAGAMPSTCGTQTAITRAGFGDGAALFLVNVY